MMSIMAEHDIGQDGLVCQLRSPIEITHDSKETKSEIHPRIDIL
jgi:hypothetical protein